MPNAPKTPTRTFRVPTETWEKAQKVAAKNGVTLTSVLVKCLEDYVAESE